MKGKTGVAKPLLITILMIVVVIEFLILSLFYDLEFDYIVYKLDPYTCHYSSIPMYQSPVTLAVLKHECFFARVEVHISTYDYYSSVVVSFPDGRIVNLTGENEYVFTTVLPGIFPIPGNSGMYSLSVNNHSVSMNKPVEVFLEKAELNHHYENNANVAVLANMTVTSGFALIKVKVWGVML